VINPDGQTSAQTITQLICIGNEQLPLTQKIVLMNFNQFIGIQDPKLLARWGCGPLPAGQLQSLLFESGKFEL
jgi:hypothetical protein